MLAIVHELLADGDYVDAIRKSGDPGSVRVVAQHPHRHELHDSLLDEPHAHRAVVAEYKDAGRDVLGPDLLDCDVEVGADSVAQLGVLIGKRYFNAERTRGRIGAIGDETDLAHDRLARNQIHGRRIAKADLADL